LPLFLELVRLVGESDPQLAAKALDGLARYEQAGRPGNRPDRPPVTGAGPGILRDCGGTGPPAVLIPSLINPPDVLDLDSDVSLADAVARMGRRTYLLDWGPARERSALGLGGHVEQILLPLLRELDSPPALVGYCLGGTMAIAAANLADAERVATLAAPWRFAAYPAGSREALKRLWEAASPAAATLGALPMEVLQSAFWSLDPLRTVAKFARFSELEPGSPEAQRFVTLEDWANEGEPLPLPAARDLIEGLFGRDLPGKGDWRVGGKIVSDRLDCPLINITAANDRITPAESAPAGDKVPIESGHVGMIVGSARTKLHSLLKGFLADEGSRR